MKKIGLLLSALFAVTCTASAQVSLDVTLEQDQFLAGESMPVVVRVVNRSGQTLKLGDDQDWLSFSVESKDSYVITKKGEVPVDDYAFTLPTSKQAKKEVDLAPYFGFSEPGRYTVTASLYIKEWNQQISSKPVPFDVIVGTKIWEQEIGLPKTEGATDSIPEVRRYALFQANFKKRPMLYVQISDLNGKVYRVFPVGPLLAFGRPEPLHILHQDGPRTYNYSVLDPHGTLLVRHGYDMAPRPRLQLNAEGKLEVIGGIRRVKSTDIPKPVAADDHVQTAKP